MSKHFPNTINFSLFFGNLELIVCPRLFLTTFSTKKKSKSQSITIFIMKF